MGWVAGASESAMIAYLIMWGIFTGCLYVATRKLSIALQWVFITLTILFFLLAIGEATRDVTIKLVSGYEGILCGLIAIYTGVAILLNEMYGKTVLPIGQPETK
jgi:succinate-acetate transporter protein